MQRTAFIFIIVSLIVSCTDQKVNKDIIELYFTSNMAEVNTPFHQSDFIDSVKYINILSDDKIGNISSMKYCNGYYYLDNNGVMVKNYFLEDYDGDTYYFEDKDFIQEQADKFLK